MEKNKFKRILRWPEGYIDNYVPWYVILWRFVFLPFIITSVTIAYISIFIGYGKYEANRFIKWSK